jgi:triphosphatase
VDVETASSAEIEWQLEALDLDVVRRWLEHGLEGSTLTIGSESADDHTDVYVDTRDRRLDRAGYSVRVRRRPGRPPEATLKSLNGAGADALRIRLEIEEELETDDPAALARAPGAVGERIRALVGANDLEPLFALDTRRCVFPLAHGGAPSGDLELDETAIRDPRGRILSRLRRVEVEVPEAALDTVAPLVEQLQQGCGLHPAALSKYEAALVASGRARTEPEGYGPTAVEPGAGIGEVGLSVLREQFATMLAHEPGARIGDDPGELHQMRVATRRLRAALSLFAETLPVEAERLAPELRWIGKVIGAVRDLDVQLARLDGSAAWQANPAEDPRPLVRAVLADERAKARRKMLRALDSLRYERFVRRFGRMLQSRSGSRTARAHAAAPELVGRRHAALREAIVAIQDDADADAYHRVRLAAKQFRYALEFLADVYPGETKRLVARATKVQDLLGGYQDAHVGTAKLRGLASVRGAELEPETIFAMGQIAAQDHARMDEIRPDLKRACKKLDGKGWKRLRRHMEAMVT